MLKGASRFTTITARNGERSFTARASTGPTSGFSIVGQSSGGKNYTGGLLDGFIDVRNEVTLRRMYREMLELDSIAGPTIQMISDLPFSDFNLGGVSDKKIIEKYMECMDRLRLKMLLPAISTDYLCDGAFLGTLNFNSDEKIYDSIMPQDLDTADLTFVPVFGADPLVKIKLDKKLIKAFDERTERGRQLAEQLPADILKAIKNGGEVEIDPENVLYIPRRIRSTKPQGTSILQRLLPIYLMERGLIRGTIEQTMSRRRAIKHITVGGEDDWTVTPEELQNIARQVLAAEMDPDNAVLATPTGVNISEIAQGGDFWKFSDVYDFGATAKMRALGINDAFLSGDATYSTLDASLSVFVDNLRSYRGMVTREIFYERIFPKVAEENNFLSKGGRTYRETGSNNPREVPYIDFRKDANDNWIMSSSARYSSRTANAKFQMPTVIWHKRLEPEGDAAYLDMLNGLSEKGVPISARMLAAAGGLQLEDLMAEMDEDLKTRTKIAEYQKKLAELMPKTGEDGEFASAIIKAAGKGVTRRKTFLSRDFSETGSTEFHKNGQPRLTSARRRREIDEKINRRIARIMATNARNPKYRV